MFVAYEISLELIRALGPVLVLLAKHDKDLMKQTRRAASSVALNLKEGNRRLGADRTYHFSVAAGSADEVRGALDVAQAWGYLKPEEIQRARELLDRQLRLLWGLTHPKGD